MSRLADPTICPDCRAPLSAAGCTSCGLRLVGPLAQRLWETMLGADRLVEQLRAADAPVPAPAPASPVPHPVGRRAARVREARSTPRPRTRLLPALSVPVVLLSLGALCLLVAAVVFVAIAWGELGLTGRTLVLIGVTSLLAAIAVVLTRRGLRGAAETFWLIVAAMLTLDLTAARSAGLASLDRLSWHGAGLLVGGSLFLLGASVCLWSRRTPTTRLLGLETVAVTGSVVATVAGAWLAERPEPSAAAAVPVLAALMIGVHRRLPRVGQALAVLAALTWVQLAGLGLARALDQGPVGPWWSHLHGWPLALAAAYAVAASLSSRLPLAARATLTGLALACLGVLATAPITPGVDTREALTRAGTLVVLAVVIAYASRVWAYGAAAVGLIGGLLVGLHLVSAPWLAQVYAGPRPAAWIWVASGLALAALAAAAPRIVPTAAIPAARQVALQTVTAAASLGVAAAVTTTAGVPRWGHVAAYLVATSVMAARAWTRRASVPAALTGGAAAGYLALVTLDLASPSALLTAGASTVIAVSMLAAFARGQHLDGEISPPLTLALAVLAGTLACTAWVSVIGLDGRAAALTVAAYAGVVALLARPASRREVTRWAWELGAVVPAVVALLLAPDTQSVAWVLTELGTVLAVFAVGYADRTRAGWAVVVVLLVATLTRLDVASVPEAVLWVLPAAVLLIGGGLLRRGSALPTLVGSGVGVGYVALATLATGGLPDRWTTALGAAIGATAAALYARLERRGLEWVPAATGILAAWSGAVAVLGGAALLGADATTRPLALAVYAALIAVLAAPGSRTALSRLALESASVPVALVCLALSPDAPTLAMVLTVLGTAAALSAVLHRDREALSWLGVAVLGAATVVRVLAHVQAPELYTLPAAALLLAAGVHRLRLDGESDSLRCLGSGLTLALVPSLLLSIDDPVSLRGALLAAGAVLVLAYGVTERLAAPFGFGAVTIALLALRHLGPISEAVPRWVALAVLGLALLAVGISWEQRLREVRSARRYLLALR